MFPSGEVATPERVTEQFPAINVFAHIIETDERHEILWAVDHLGAMRSMHNIPAELTDDEAIAELQELRNAPPPEPEVTADERIAAALEFQNLVSHGKVSSGIVELNYDHGLWDEGMVHVACKCGEITPNEYKEITGEKYMP
jgi:hypothetical protein